MTTDWTNAAQGIAETIVARLDALAEEAENPTREDQVAVVAMCVKVALIGAEIGILRRAGLS